MWVIPKRNHALFDRLFTELYEKPSSFQHWWKHWHMPSPPRAHTHTLARTHTPTHTHTYTHTHTHTHTRVHVHSQTIDLVFKKKLSRFLILKTRVGWWNSWCKSPRDCPKFAKNILPNSSKNTDFFSTFAFIWQIMFLLPLAGFAKRDLRWWLKRIFRAHVPSRTGDLTLTRGAHWPLCYEG